MQRGVFPAEALAQRATFGAEHATSQCRSPTSTLHDVVPKAVPTPVLLVLLPVAVERMPSGSPPVTLPFPLLLTPLLMMVLVLVLMLVLLEIASAPAPVPARHRTRTAEEKRGRSPFPPAGWQVRACPCSAAMVAQSSCFLFLWWPFALP